MDIRVLDKTKFFIRPVTDGAARPQFLSLEPRADSGFLQGNGPNISGCTVNQNLRKLVSNSNQDVISSVDQPITVAGGAGLWERLAPERARVKGAGVPDGGLNLEGLALCVGGEGKGFAGVANSCSVKACVTRSGETPADSGTGEMAQVVTLSGQGNGPGPGGIIETGAIKGMSVRQTADAARGKRKKDWQSHKTNFSSCALWSYAQMFGPAATGAVTHPGAAGESNADADV